MRPLASRGARPSLLVSSTPYTAGEAGDWWRQAAQAGDIVPEVYFNAPAITKQGVILGSRRMRTALRSAVAAYTAIGIPVAKIGFVLGFQSGPGAGGREGLQPSSAWFEFTKLYTLAAKQVAAEFGIATVWSWGWGTFNVAGADPDKQAEQAIIDGSFGGSRPAFTAALAKGGANIYVARAAIADELLRVQAEASIAVPGSTEPQIQAFYATYSDTLVRPFKVTPAASWLGNRTSGFALAVAAPSALFRLPSAVASPFTTGLGSYTVTPLDQALPLGALPLEQAGPAIRTALLTFARSQAYEDAARKRSESALNRTICLRDDLPDPAAVSVSTYLPFLALSS